MIILNNFLLRYDCDNTVCMKAFVYLFIELRETFIQIIPNEAPQLTRKDGMNLFAYKKFLF